MNTLAILGILLVALIGAVAFYLYRMGDKLPMPSGPVVTATLAGLGVDTVGAKPSIFRNVKFQGYAPEREAFAAWRDDPVTLFVFAALRKAHEAQREQWLIASWEGGIAEPLLLRELQTRADAYASLEEGGYEQFCEWAGVEPEPVEDEEAA